MACPRCGCKETNHYDDEDALDDNWERCAACGVIFDTEDHAEEEMDPHIDGVVPTPMAAEERDFLVNGLRRIYAAYDDEGNDLSALAGKAADAIAQMPSNA